MEETLEGRIDIKERRKSLYKIGEVVVVLYAFSVIGIIESKVEKPHKNLEKVYVY